MNRLSAEKGGEQGGRSGFALSELVVALILLAIGLVGGSSILVTESRTRRHAQCTSLAAHVASEKVGDVEAAGYHAIEQGKLSSSFSVPELPQGHGLIRCETDASAKPRGDYLVTVTVTWGAGKAPEGRAVKCGVVPCRG